MRIYRSITEPIKEINSYEERIEGADKGVINSWYVGRKLAVTNPDLCIKAKNGELPVLTVKGGVERKIKKDKTGSLWYLASWQGLRGEDLDIDLGAEVKIVCSRTGVGVTFTGDIKKLFEI